MESEKMRNQSHSEQVNKLVLICIDGLSWNLLLPFCEKGILPNFARFIKNGASGELRSFKLSISPRIWATIYTGKDPEKHGVEDFYTNTVKTKQIWEILHENGEKIGVFSALTAFEAQRVNGFFVPGCLALTTSAYPPDLEFLKELSMEVRYGKLSLSKLVKYGIELIRHGCRITTLFNATLSYLINHSNARQCMYKEIESIINSDVFIHCLRKYAPAFSVFYDNGIDCVSHFYWKYMEPEFFNNVDKESVNKYKDIIEDYYIRMDEIVGRIASIADNGTTLVIVSDHGFEACPSYKGDIECSLFVGSVLDSLDLEDKVYGIKVFCGGLFRPKNSQIDLREVEDVFKKVRFQNTGKEVFKVTCINSHVNVKINTESITREDEIVILPDSSECTLKTLVDFVPERSGDHNLDGVIIISGPGILCGEPIRDASIFDLAPTILALRKMPIPDDMDGKVLSNIFKEPINEKDLERIPSYDSKPLAIEPSIKEELSNEEETRIKERLRELGYF